MALLPFASEKWSLGALVCPVPLEGRARVSPEYIPVSPVEVTPQSWADGPGRELPASGTLSSLDLKLKPLVFSIPCLCCVRAGVYNRSLDSHGRMRNGWKKMWSAAASISVCVHTYLL